MQPPKPVKSATALNGHVMLLAYEDKVVVRHVVRRLYLVREVNH
jgi:hypothetical protein